MLIGSAFISAFLGVTYMLLDFCKWIVIIGGVLSWLIAFGVVNPYNKAINAVSAIISRITEPLLAPIRRTIPPMGGVDLSPLFLFFAIYFLQLFVVNISMRMGG